MIVSNMCCSLRTRVIYMSWISMIISVVQILGSSFIINANDISDNNTPEDKKILKLITIVTSLYLIGSIISLIITLRLIISIKKKRPHQLILWIRIYLVLLIGSFLIISISGGLCFTNIYLRPIGLGLYLIFIPLAGLQIYYWHCVYKLNKTFKDTGFF